MKKLLGVLALVGGIYYFTRKTDQPQEAILLNPLANINREVEKYEGTIVIDANGNWTYVLNGILRPLSEKGLIDLRSKNVKEIVITTLFWAKYPQLQGSLYL